MSPVRIGLSIFALACPFFDRNLLCSQEATIGATGEQVAYFEKHIRPLLIESCYECHSTASGKRAGGLLLDSRAGWESGGDSGPSIVPFDAEASLLVAAVRYSDEDLQMPPEAKLEADQIAHLEKWIRMGAPDPRSEGSVHPGDDKSEIPTDPSDPIAGREHWAFGPLGSSQPPAVADQDWPVTAVDAFVLSKLESEGLSPAPEADRRTLIRRLSFQLRGIPPEPDEVDAFICDSSSDAYQRLVDQMLGSPSFAQRWGRHWLDLARYADSNGLDENFLFREAWRFRNWVIEALNQDMPIDRFAIEQIAGDLLPYDSIEQRDRQRTAAGFLVVGPKVLLGNDPRERVMDIADEQLDTIGKTFLGMTLGCARCHNHKFDPIPTADYYAMAGIFTSTRVLETRYMLGQQREMEQLIGIGEGGEQRDDEYEAFWRSEPGLKQKLQHAKAALDHLNKNEETELAKLIEEHADSVAEAIKDSSLDLEARVQAQSQFIEELARALSPPPIPPRSMVPIDIETPRDEAIRLSGQFDRSGQVVPRGALRVISDDPISITDGQSGRLELAQWLFDVERGAGRLVARVMANRIWHHLIGRGLVRTVDNFGRTGERPSHPELLDYLAGELIRSDWSTKSLIRTIVTSQAFKMSSQHDPLAHQIDPDNRLLWRANRRRLDPESLRDAMLMAGKQLDLTPMDSSVWYLGDQATAVGKNENRRRTDFPCRSVYLPVIRNDLPELFDAFDFADPHATTGMRPDTMVASQGFFIMNDSSVLDAADAIAKRVLSESGQGSDHEIADALCRLVLGDHADEATRDALVRFVQSAKQQAVDDPEGDENVAAWSAACHALLASSRFQILE